MHDPALPAAELLDTQAKWLRPVRARLLRRIGIGHRHSILDLGAGYGSTTGELLRRSGGSVYALDLNTEALHEIDLRRTLFRIAGNASDLPFKASVFDLVFCQCALMWMAPLAKVLSSIQQVLRPGGQLVAIEPDYGGLIEWPPDLSTRHLWLAALKRSGAIPEIGRQLPGLLEEMGFGVEVFLFDQLIQASDERFKFLDSLPLTQTEISELKVIREIASEMVGWQQIAHLPYFLIIATKPGN